MKTKITMLTQAISGILVLATLPGAANAVLITPTQTKTFSDTRTVTATRTNTGSGTTPQTASTAAVTLSGGNFDGFDSSLGVLKSIVITTPTGTRSQSIKTQGIGGANGVNKIAQGQHRMSALTLSTGAVIPVSQQVSGTISYAPGTGSPPQNSYTTCSTTGTAGCGPTTAVSGTNTGNATLASEWKLVNADTAYFVGGPASKEIKTSFNSTSLAGNQNSNGFTTVNAEGSGTWSGSVSLSYEYVAHANPVLSDAANSSSQTIDFGTYLVGNPTTPAQQQYQIANVLRPNTAVANQSGLTVKSYSSAGDTTVFSADPTTTPPFNIAPDDLQVFTADFLLDPNSTPKSYEATYTFQMEDQGANLNLNSSYQTYSQTLTLKGALLAIAAGSFCANDAETCATNTLDRNDPVTSLLIDFGAFDTLGITQKNFDIWNLIGNLLPSQIVDLKFLGCTSSGDTANFNVDICGSTNNPIISASGTTPFTALAQFFPPALGGRTATYVLEFVAFAPNLQGYAPGAEPRQFLTITVTGIPEPGTVALLGAGLFGFGLRRKQQG